MILKFWLCFYFSTKIWIFNHNFLPFEYLTQSCIHQKFRRGKSMRHRRKFCPESHLPPSPFRRQCEHFCTRLSKLYANNSIYFRYDLEFLLFESELLLENWQKGRPLYILVPFRTIFQIERYNQFYRAATFPQRRELQKLLKVSFLVSQFGIQNVMIDWTKSDLFYTLVHTRVVHRWCTFVSVALRWHHQLYVVARS